MFGRDFENYSDDKPVANGDAKEVTAPTATQPATSKDAQGATTSLTTSNVDKSKKSKVNAKSTGLTYQFQIVRPCVLAYDFSMNPSTSLIES